MKELLKNKYSLFLVIVASVIFGFFLCMMTWRTFNGNNCTTKLEFIKPNIDCDSFDQTAEKLSSLQDKLQVMILTMQKTGKIKRGSVFVRDLKTSRFAGVNETDTFYMASLLKTPLVIGGFKLAEVEPKILDQEIVYTGAPDLYGDQIVKSNETMKVGTPYSIRELMRRSVVYSDNTASQMLFDFYPVEFLDRILQALGIQVTRPNGETENLITARSYSNVFRVLYNSSYLTKEYSNEALSILTQTQFATGATSKLPKGTLVAHKFAERTMVTDSGQVASKQFHECGIVYANKSKDPYIFCIMTEGNDYEVMEGVIADISLSIFEEITNQ